ncbi:hypothetical protein AB840_11630 [Megasphaera cerevisiae DSM 20462]|jgi:hypothetical protein|uniref:Uncharacterized protein n=1 Tax=Megasphaera cerevisiae DSM 20462 TaxID=1122219 RepID=A0A0J6WQQ5_9FIRM|nr:hypothetical protein [Megasphaera cerevisiae]KMO85770.1 hypothetical protein AB840_11630 [Megasphaera cerevisiae DSM 20462]MCI1750998.1 hypothetical protein [Megasphaera cerevisiae]OKY53551.1 hypothetical protein BSR42_07160 [Megasphaera cerevisiae]SKA10255.1 hypothetical protein SAMN05660900_02438 [Megasphaera cerevisiae DSM 20462]
MKKRTPLRLDIKVLTALLVIFCCIKAAFAAYTDVYMKTPDYAFARIMEAASRGDVDTVSDAADEKAIIGQLFDSLINRKDSSAATLPLVKLSWEPLKQEAIENGQILITGQIAADTASPVYSNAKTTIDRRLKALGFPVPSAGWHYISASWGRQTEPGHAEITAVFYNDALKSSVPCTFTLERKASREWNITGITNAVTLLTAVETAYQKELAVQNEPIQKQIDDTILIRDVSSRLIHTAEGGQTFLRITYTPELKAKRENITEIKGQYELRRTSDKAVLYTAPIRLSLSSAKQTHVSQFLLNPFIPSQYTLIKRSDLDGTKSTLHITSVLQTDGTSWILSDTLSPSDTAQP